MTDRPIIFSSSETKWKVAASRLKMPVDEYVAILNQGKKLCGGCRRIYERTSVHFGADNKHFDGLRSRCRTCVQSLKKAHYHATRPQQRAKQLLYQHKNREKLYAYNAEWQRKRHRELRCEAIEAYGGECVCCGENEPTFLDLDHIHNDGHQHRVVVGNTTRLMIFLKRDGWPRDRIQLLCCNCNQGKDRNGGICPHKEMRDGR